MSLVITDRDGVLIEDGGYMHRAQDVKPIPGAFDGVSMLKAAGVLVAVATNQSGIGRGLYGVADFDAMQQELERQLLTATGYSFDFVAYCPHAPSDRCGCRKPLPGLIDQILEALAKMDHRDSAWMVGDRPSDLRAGAARGLRTLLVRTGQGSNVSFEDLPAGSTIVDDFRQAAHVVLSELGKPSSAPISTPDPAASSPD